MSNPANTSDFNFIAPFYDPLSRLVFGNSLRKAQSLWLNRVPKNADILVFGGGSGWLLARILAVCSPQKVIYVDASPVMIALARKAVNNDNRVDFRIGTETVLKPSDRVHALFTPFILDLFSDDYLLNHLIPTLCQSLQTNGFWFCSDFVEPTKGWQRVIMWSQYRFFRTFSHIGADRLPNWMPLLNTALNSQPLQMGSFFGGMIASGYWQKP